MILGITCICIHWLYGYRYTVSSFVQYVVTIAKLNLGLRTIYFYSSSGGNIGISAIIIYYNILNY